jgi:hypothetical protein
MIDFFRVPENRNALLGRLPPSGALVAPEKPAAMFKRLGAEVAAEGIKGRTGKSLQDYMRRAKLHYMKANSWLRSTGAGIDASDPSSGATVTGTVIPLHVHIFLHFIVCSPFSKALPKL